MTSTPGDLMQEMGAYAKTFIDMSAPFDESIYDWTDEELRDYIYHNSKNNFIYIKFSYKQLGRSEKWFENQCRALAGDLFKIKREILLEWNKSNDLSPFTEEAMDKLYANVKEPIAKLIIDKYYIINLYEDFDFHSPLLIGCDTSGGLSQDRNAFTVVNPINMHVVADFKNAKMDTVEYSNLLYDMVKKYFINACLVIERNSYGKAVIDMLIKTDIEKNVYYEFKTILAEKKTKDIKKQDLSVTPNKTKVYGVNTDNHSRPLMIDLLFNIVENEYDSLNSKDLVDEIRGLERHKDKIEHGPLNHDDVLMSYLFTRYIYTYGTNLGKFFISKKSNNPYIDSTSITNNFISQFSSILKFNQQEDLSKQNSAFNEIIQMYQDKINNEKMRKIYNEEVLDEDDQKYLTMKNIFDLNK